MTIPAEDPRLDDRDALAALLAEAARRAAATLLAMRAARDVRIKADGSPVCSADMAADAAAKRALAELLPGIPVISEESVGEVAAGRVFVLLDPLDGTREFLADGDSYCVCIAVVRDGRPLAGAIAAPALGRLWSGGVHAFHQALGPAAEAHGDAERIAVSPVPQTGLRLLVSRFHGDATSERIAASLGPGKGVPVSSAVKFGLLAVGEADLHLRGGTTMEWDIAAGDAILGAAGGAVLTLSGERPLYGCAGRGYRNPAFVAAGSEALALRAVAAARSIQD